MPRHPLEGRFPPHEAFESTTEGEAGSEEEFKRSTPPFESLPREDRRRIRRGKGFLSKAARGETTDRVASMAVLEKKEMEDEMAESVDLSRIKGFSNLAEVLPTLPEELEERILKEIRQGKTVEERQGVVETWCERLKKDGYFSSAAESERGEEDEEGQRENEMLARQIERDTRQADHEIHEVAGPRIGEKMEVAPHTNVKTALRETNIKERGRSDSYGSRGDEKKLYGERGRNKRQRAVVSKARLGSDVPPPPYKWERPEIHSSL